MLTGLGQNGKGSGMDAPNSSIADGEPLAMRQNLTHTVTCTERGKPVGLPEKESEPQVRHHISGPGYPGILLVVN